MTDTRGDPDRKLTSERFREVWDLAGEMIAAETAWKLWQNIHAQRRAIREVAKGI
jgi:hypothetical protein